MEKDIRVFTTVQNKKKKTGETYRRYYCRTLEDTNSVYLQQILKKKKNAIFGEIHTGGRAPPKILDVNLKGTYHILQT